MTLRKSSRPPLPSLICICSVTVVVAACGRLREPHTPSPTQAPISPPSPTLGPSNTLVSPGRPLDPFEQAQVLGRGVNFGNALEAPHEGEWGIVLEDRFFDLAQAGGFQTIRLPVRWSAHADAQPPYKIDQAFFERVDWAIANATRRGLNIVVNMHHYEELMSRPADHRARFIALWRQIAERYRDQPHSMVFELCNEPNGMSSAQWNRIAQEALDAVRSTNPTRNIIIGGTDWNSVHGLMDLVLPDSDTHLIATFHYYLPFEFTHQGAEWVNGSSAWLGTQWLGTQDDKSRISHDLDRAMNWSQANRRPVWLGEFGAYRKADMESRLRWTSYIAREAERREISWAYWEFGADFGVYDRSRNAWNDPLLEALIP